MKHSKYRGHVVKTVINLTVKKNSNIQTDKQSWKLKFGKTFLMSHCDAMQIFHYADIFAYAWLFFFFFFFLNTTYSLNCIFLFTFLPCFVEGRKVTFTNSRTEDFSNHSKVSSHLWTDTLYCFLFSELPEYRVTDQKENQLLCKRNNTTHLMISRVLLSDLSKLIF